MKINPTKDILKWIALIPFSILITILVSTLMNVLVEGFGYFTYFDQSRWTEDISPPFIDIIWQDSIVNFFSLYLALKFIGEKYYKPATIVLFVFRIFTLLIPAYIYFNHSEFINTLILFIPTLIPYSFVFYKGFYRSDWDFLRI